MHETIVAGGERNKTVWNVPKEVTSDMLVNDCKKTMCNLNTSLTIYIV